MLLGPPSQPAHQDPGAAWDRTVQGGSRGPGLGQGEWGGQVKEKRGCLPEESQIRRELGD